ncbi:MAG TPA: hypothetical protein VLH94_00985 [Spirochaetia bacterium]|nr:hypothetical protein [Spirochaetia bacterium]
MTQQWSEKKPVIYILPLAKIKLDTYVRLAKGEVSGLGKVRALGRMALLIEDVFILEQRCNDVDTAINPKKICELMTTMIMSGEDISCLRLWWHSHAGGNTFWSPKDKENIYGFNAEWMLSLVTNYAGEYLCRVDAFHPVQTTVDGCPLQIYFEEDDLLTAQLQEEIDNMVTTIVPEEQPVLIRPYLKGRYRRLERRVGSGGRRR